MRPRYSDEDSRSEGWLVIEGKGFIRVCACWAGQVAGGSRDRDVVVDRYRPSGSSTAANDAAAAAAAVVLWYNRGCGCGSLMANQVWIVGVSSYDKVGWCLRVTELWKRHQRD